MGGDGATIGVIEKLGERGEDTLMLALGDEGISVENTESKFIKLGICMVWVYCCILLTRSGRNEEERRRDSDHELQHMSESGQASLTRSHQAQLRSNLRGKNNTSEEY